MKRNIDLEQGLDYMAMESSEGMPLQEFVQLVEEGVGVCEDYCESRDKCGQVACHCIRSVFPHPDYFLLYERMRQVRCTQEFSKYLEDNGINYAEG